MKRVFALAAGLLVTAVAPAGADDFTFTFTAAGQIGTGTFTTDGVTIASRGYTAQTITSITGLYNGSTITALMPGLFGADDLYYVSGPSFVDGSGVGFRTVAGNQVNLFYQDSIPSYRVNTLNPFTTAFVTATSARVTAVPEATSWTMMVLGFGVIGVGLRRRGITARQLQAA